MGSSSYDIIIDTYLEENLWLKYNCESRQGPSDIVKQRKQFGEFSTLFQTLRINEDKFHEYTRMTVATFDYILQIYETRLKLTSTNFHISDSITPAEKLVVTIRIVSIVTVFVNKALLSNINLDAPIFIIITQTLTTVAVCLMKKYLSLAFPSRFSFPPINIFHKEVIKQVLPVSVMFTSMIALNTLCLKYVTVAFYYIGRSLTTIFNVIFTYLIVGEMTSRKCILFCIMIIFGFYLGVDQENIAGSLSMSGTVYGILGSLSLSLYSILTKRALPKLNNEIWVLAYGNNFYATIMLLPIMYMNGDFGKLWNYEGLSDIGFWLILLAGGICGFTIGLFTSLQIKYTSALTHNISGTAKACAQTVLATYWYQETKSSLWWFSNGIVLLGSAGYARVKQLDMERKHMESTYSQKV